MFDQKTAQDFYGSKTIFFRIACRLALAVCDRNLFISYDQFQSITSHVQVKNPVVVRSSLMKGSSWRENLDAREALRRPSRDSLNVGFFCWLTCDQIDRKGFSETYDALVALNAAGTGFVYKLIVGGASGDALPYLTDLAKTGLLDMELRLDLSHELKAQYFADIDIFVNVSSYEGFGNASLEAMSFGVPVVVSRFGAAPEVVGEAGAVVFDITSSNIAAGINAVAEKLLRQDGGFKSAITIQLEKFSFEARRQGLTAALLG